MEEFFEDIFDDNIEEDLEIEEPFDGDPVEEDEPEQTESQDGDELTVNPIIICGAMGIAYEEGLRERKRRKRKKFSDDSK